MYPYSFAAELGVGDEYNPFYSDVIREYSTENGLWEVTVVKKRFEELLVAHDY